MSKHITIPVTDSIHAALLSAAKATGVTLAEYVRSAALDKAGISEQMGQWGGLSNRLAGIYISVANGRAAVARTVDEATVEATNADALESDALVEVKAQGGGPFLSGIYECPAGLARRAEWS